jgi:hypothetical protein
VEQSNDVHDAHLKRELSGRTLVSLLLPVAVAYFYSRWVALAIALPCAVSFAWNLRRAVRWYVKGERPR